MQPAAAAGADGVALVPLPALDADGRGRLQHDGRGYAVFTLDGELIVTDESCPHRGGPLSEGALRDGGVVCPWHWFVFDLGTGECRTATVGPLRRHPVVDVGGVPHARIEPVVVRSWSTLLRDHARSSSPRPTQT
jgi:nitrite reductase/ring-hydroxylating ferredoxin subunit